MKQTILKRSGWKFIIVLTLFSLSCHKPEEEVLFDTEKWEAEHLEFPDQVINLLAKGELNSECLINYIFLDFTERYFYFTYLPGTHKIQRIHIENTTASCYTGNYDFIYNSDLIDRVEVLEKTNACADILRVYKFTYEKGILKRIQYDDGTYFIEESYFSYYPDGRIKKLFHNYRYRTDQNYLYTEVSFFYDSLGNVTKVIRDDPEFDEYDYVLTYTYDTGINPMKGSMYHLKTYLWGILGYEAFIGPGFLSENNLKTSAFTYSGKTDSIYYDLEYTEDRLTKYHYNYITSRFYYEDCN